MLRFVNCHIRHPVVVMSSVQLQRHWDLFGRRWLTHLLFFIKLSEADKLTFRRYFLGLSALQLYQVSLGARAHRHVEALASFLSYLLYDTLLVAWLVQARQLLSQLFVHAYEGAATADLPWSGFLWSATHIGIAWHLLLERWHSAWISLWGISTIFFNLIAWARWIDDVDAGGRFLEWELRSRVTCDGEAAKELAFAQLAIWPSELDCSLLFRGQLFLAVDSVHPLSWMPFEGEKFCHWDGRNGGLFFLIFAWFFIFSFIFFN